MSDTVVNDDATWSRRKDNSIWMWDEDSLQWKPWDATSHPNYPLPPDKWIVALASSDTGGKDEHSAAELPQTKARAAKEVGDKIFQIALPLPVDPTAIQPLEDIEDEGWTLEHAGYVYEPTEARIVGVYIFRARDDDR